jgi:hypothetical protein
MNFTVSKCAFGVEAYWFPTRVVTGSYLRQVQIFFMHVATMSLFYTVQWVTVLQLQNFRKSLTVHQRAGVAQSVQCLTADWTAGVRSLTQAEDFSSNLCVQTGSGAHTPGALSPVAKRGQGVMLTTHPLLVPRLTKTGAIPPVTQMRLYGA